MYHKRYEYEGGNLRRSFEKQVSGAGILELEYLSYDSPHYLTSPVLQFLDNNYSVNNYLRIRADNTEYTMEGKYNSDNYPVEMLISPGPRLAVYAYECYNTPW